MPPVNRHVLAVRLKYPKWQSVENLSCGRL